MPYAFTLTSRIPATAQEIYEAWLDSLAHSEMTGGEAVMSDEIGAEVSAWNGYITGRNLELAPGERIVQSWRTTKFADEHEDSIITVLLEPIEEGTLLTLVHSNVPDEQRNYEEGGWESNYFEPMRVYFATRSREAAEAPPEPGQPKPAAKRAGAAAKPKRAKPPTKPPAKPEGGAATKAKAKRAAPVKKAKAVKKTVKNTVKKTAKKTAKKTTKKKPAKPKPGRSKRR
jgi:uncharacterized protein YndB with AHSA1/START domain